MVNGSIEAIKETMNIYENLKKSSAVPVETLDDMNKQLEIIRKCTPILTPFTSEAFHLK